MSIAMNIYMQRGGGTIRHSRFIHERMLLCQRLFHECLGYDLERISLVAKTCPGLIPWFNSLVESSGFIPVKTSLAVVFQWLALFHRYNSLFCILNIVYMFYMFVLPCGLSLLSRL